MIKKIALLMLCMIVISSGAYASKITDGEIIPTSWEYPYIQNGNIKLETHYDFWNSDNDKEPCEELFCFNQAYDYILNPATNEVIGKWSMFKLQRKQGNDWKNLQIVEHSYEDCSSEGTACMKRVMKLNENTFMNVTYELKENDNKVKFTIDINSGLNREYRLKYRLLSNENINYTEENKATFGDYFYDWNDIIGLDTESIVSEDGLTLDQITYIGMLDAGETISIDPLIESSATQEETSQTNILRDSAGNLWFYAKTATNRNMYKSDDEGATWSLNDTTTTNITANAQFASVIDSNDDIHIMESGTLYTIFDTSTGTWTDSNPSLTLSGYKYASIDEDDTIALIGIGASSDCYGYKRTSAGVWTTTMLDADGCNFGNNVALITNNTIVYGFTDDGSTVDGTYRIFLKNKSDLSTITSSTIISTASGAILGGSGIIYDYDNDITMLCADTRPSWFQLTCKYTNVTSINTGASYYEEPAYSFNYYTTNAIGIFEMGINNNNTFIVFVKNAVDPVAIKMNATDFAGGDIDFAWEEIIPIDTESTISTASRIQVAQTKEDNIYLAYKDSVGADWYSTTFPEDIFIQAYDEETGDIILDWDLSISNSTDADTETAIDSYFGDWSGLTTIRVSKTGYAYRFYYLDLDASNTPYYLNAYLLNSSSGNYVRFHIYDQNSNTEIGASVTAYKFIDGVYTPVEIGMTDGSGTATLFLDPVVAYRIGVTQENCTALNTTITPTSEDYAIQLSCTGGGTLANYTAEYTGFTWEIYPSATGLCNTTTQAFYVYLDDTESLLGSYSVNLTNSTGDSLWYDSGSVAGGENMTTTENLASYSGGEVLTLTLIVNRSTFSSEKTFIHNYYVWDWNCANDGAYNTSLMSIVNKVNAGTWEIDDMTLLLIALFISIAAAGMTFAIAGVGGGGASVIFLLTFGTMNMLFNFMDWGVFGLIAMGALAVAFIR